MPAHLSRSLLALGLAAFSLTRPVSSLAGNPCAPVPPGLVGWWKLEGNANDATGLHNGTAVGGSYVAGEVGQGFAPASVGDGIQIPDDAALNPTNFTLDCWVRLDALTDYNAGVIWKGNVGGADASSPFGLGIFGLTGGPPSSIGLPFLTIGAGTSSQEVDSSLLAPLGTFFHLAGTADGTTLNLYLNGVLVGTAPQTLIPVASVHPLQLGGVTQAGALNPGPTVIDEVEVHNVAATAAQILAIYQAGPSGKCPILPTPVEHSTWGGLKVRHAG